MGQVRSTRTIQPRSAAVSFRPTSAFQLPGAGESMFAVGACRAG
jgi:hypothetical protein